MCGIFGMVGEGASRLAASAPDQGRPPPQVSQALRALHHRGPEGRGFLFNGAALLGHTRLRVIDLSEAGAQPMSNRDGTVHVTFNGEIYNHQVLRRELQARGHQFRSRTDTEVLVYGYEEWGDDLMAHLDGMFAFAIWDSRKQTLLLARDRAGEKPLFYAYDEARGTLCFASEIKALFPLGVAVTPRAQSLPMLLSFGYVAAPDTLYEGVSQLPPACALRLRLDHKEAPALWRYWQAPFASQPRATLTTEARARVRQLTVDAVRTRLESDVALGAFLSGGIDSSIIVGILSKILGRRVKTFSIGFAGDARFDETRFARMAASAFDTDHVEFTVDPRNLDVPPLIEELVWLHDGPFGDSSAIPTYIVSKLTREHVTVALTGDGGDELFCGYPRLLAAEMAEYIPPALLLWMRGLTRMLPSGDSERSLLARAQRFLTAAALPIADRMARWNSLFLADLYELLRPEWRARINLEEPADWQRAHFAAQPPASPLARVLDHNFSTYLPYDVLVKVDRTAMAHALETRAPFLAQDLIEYAAGLPDGYRRQGFQLKQVLREAFADLLPAPILSRGKMGFGVPLGAWFRGELRPYLEEHLDPRARLCQYLDSARLDRYLREHQSGQADHSHRLWTLLTMELWLKALPNWTRPCA